MALFPERTFYVQAKHLCDLSVGRLPLLSDGPEVKEEYPKLAARMLEQVGNQVCIGT